MHTSNKLLHAPKEYRAVEEHLSPIWLKNGIFMLVGLSILKIKKLKRVFLQALMATSASHVDFHEFKRKKIWVDKKSGNKSMMLYPRSMDVTWGFPPRWLWNCYKETSDENVEVVKLSEVCWLNVRGQFKMSELSPGVEYEIAYIIKLTNGASGWELPVTLQINILPQGKVQKRLISLLEKPRGEWMELNGGSFQTQESGEVLFELYEHGGHWKNGLIIKGIIIRPKSLIIKKN